jgi:hypothetical protein
MVCDKALGFVPAKKMLDTPLYILVNTKQDLPRKPWHTYYKITKEQ